jgi:hypothetical protein
VFSGSRTGGAGIGLFRSKTGVKLIDALDVASTILTWVKRVARIAHPGGPLRGGILRRIPLLLIERIILKKC